MSTLLDAVDLGPRRDAASAAGAPEPVGTRKRDRTADEILASGVRASLASALAAAVMLGVALVLLRQGSAALTEQASTWRVEHLEAAHETRTPANTMRSQAR